LEVVEGKLVSLPDDTMSFETFEEMLDTEDRLLKEVDPQRD
jgi:hypothetical protein